MNSRVVNFFLKGQTFMAIVKSEESGDFTYESYMDATPKIADPDECFYFMKIDGSLIPPELFIPFVNQNFQRGIDDVHVGVINTCDKTSGVAANSSAAYSSEIISVDPSQIISAPIIFGSEFCSTTIQSNSTDISETNSKLLDQLELKDLEEFIVENGGRYLLNKYRENGTLSDPHRKALIAILVKKLTNQFSCWPTKEQKIKYAKLGVEMFPTYKTIGVHYYELFFDPVKQKGFINSRLKTVQKNVRDTTDERKQKKRSASNFTKSNEKELLSENIDLDLLENQFKDDIDFLKNCPSTETSAILQRIKQTFSLRKAILDSEKKASIWNLFPCLMTSPDIVLQEYFLRTGCTNTNSKVVELVPKIFATFASLKNKKEVKEGVDDEWDSFTNAILTLLKLLPSYRKCISKIQKTSGVQLKSDNVFNKVIAFNKSNNAIDVSDPNKLGPILIAVGPVKKAILQYYIKIDGQLLPTKKNCTSVEAFDSLYKAHTAFSVGYDWELKTFYDFIQYFIYGDRDNIALTTRQKEIWKSLSV